MRFLFFISLLIFSFGCGGVKNTAMSPNKYNGSWIPVRQEMGGTTIPAASFQTQKLTISDSNYTFVAESVDKGILRYSNDKMDIYGKEGVNTGKHFTALYKYENGELSICYNLSGKAYPESFDTKGKPLYFLCVFKKEPKK